jgi:translation initiation factor 1 (eIF-1/SUI1)
MSYIKEKSLQIVDKPKYLKLDDLLIKAFYKNKMPSNTEPAFEELFTFIFSKMSPMHQIKLDTPTANPIVRKGKFQPVEFKLESRGGNKKVTCVYNLAAFELDTNVLQTKIKKILGCSVTVNEAGAAAAASEDFVLGVQGNQIYQVSDILKSRVSFF